MKVNAENTKSDNGNTVTYTEQGDKVTENSYPRNNIFNNYFNQHSVSFIYDDEYESNFVILKLMLMEKIERILALN